MTESIRASYDSVAEMYASMFRDELANDTQSLRWLQRFADLAQTRSGPVADLGCGPGSTVEHLTSLGLSVFGIDLSPGQIREARHAFPDLRFDVGDLTELDTADATLGGIVSRYSVIHLDPARHEDVFREWRRGLQPGAPLFLAFFGSRSAEAHGNPFDHKVATAYELWPARVGEQLRAVGFTDVEIDATPIPEGDRPFDHTTLLAIAPADPG